MKYLNYNDKDKIFIYKDKDKNKIELTEVKGELIGYSRSFFAGEYGDIDFFCIHLKGEEEYQIQFTYTYTTLFLMNKLLNCGKGNFELWTTDNGIGIKYNDDYPKAKFSMKYDENNTNELKFNQTWSRDQKAEHKNKIIAKWAGKLEEVMTYEKKEAKQETSDDLPF